MRAMNSSSQVSIGPASILGWLAAAGGLLTSTVQSIEGSHALASGPAKWPAILGIASLVATNLGRQFQAAHLTKAATVANDVAALPTALQALAAEAQRNAATKPPDGVDSAAVPFSGAPTVTGDAPPAAQPSAPGAPTTPAA